MALTLLAVLMAGLPPGGVQAPLVWSPDGRWLAYVLAERPAAGLFSPGWALASTIRPRRETSGAPTYRLWATRPESGESVLLAESDRVLSAPAWGPGGTALAYARLERVPGGRARLEVVIQQGLDRRRVAWSQEIGIDRPDLDAALAGTAVTWSSDGLHLGVPQVDPPGLAIIRVEGGTVVRVLEGARGFAWAPDGHRAAYYRDDVLYRLESPAGEPRRAFAAPDSAHLPAVQWSRDGQSILHVLRMEMPGLGRPRFRQPGERADLIAIDVDTGQVAPVRSLLHGPLLDLNALHSVSFAVDASGDQLFYTTTVDGQHAQLTWSFPRQNAIRTRFNPADESLPLGDLALPAIGTRLALRVGGGLEGLPALCDVATTKLHPLVPDDDARAAWIARLLSAANAALAESPLPGAEGVNLVRPVALPTPAEMDAQTTLLPRLRHLGRLGRPLTDRPVGSAPPPPEFEEGLAEARLAFTYWDHDPEHPRVSYEAAARVLDDLESLSGPSADPTTRLLARSVIALGLGEREAAQACVDALRLGQPRGRLGFEETLAGPVLEELSEPDLDWLAHLERELQSPPERPAPPRGAEPLPAVDPLLELRQRVDDVQVLPAP